MKTKEIVPRIIFISIIIACIYSFITRNNEISELRAKGVEIIAVVTQVTFARGCNIDFVYNYNGHVFKKHGNTAEFTLSVGDSIRIRVFPNKPDGAVVLDGIEYKSHAHAL
jgi:hypothetical protein